MPGTGDTAVTKVHMVPALMQFISPRGSKHLESVEILQAQAGLPNSQVSVTLTVMRVIFVFH